MKLITLMIIITIVGCGDKQRGKQNSSSSTSYQEVLDGEYRVILTPLNNGKIKHETHGTVILKIEGDSLDARINIAESPQNISHFQFIHQNEKCPEKDDDPNNDQFLDFQETKTIAGKVLLPLDGDLNEREAGMEIFPRSNHAGGYLYRQRGNLPRIQDDLWNNENQLEDYFVRMNREEHLQLSGKILVIYGIGRNHHLPPSIQVPPGKNPFDYLPIACGKLVKVLAEEN